MRPLGCRSAWVCCWWAILNLNQIWRGRASRGWCIPFISSANPPPTTSTTSANLACDYALATAGATGDEGPERCQMISGAILINLYVKHGTTHRPIRKTSDYKPLIRYGRASVHSYGGCSPQPLLLLSAILRRS
jgi:hypothetical protein